MTCESCLKLTTKTHTAVVNGRYYRYVCADCLGGKDETSGGVASYNRRRDWEDNASNTIQPYTAEGPNLEFLRVYPDKAAKIFKPSELAQLKRKI